MINIKAKHVEMYHEIFKKYCPKAEIWAYGSRVHGDSHDGSDLDLTIKSFNANGKKLYELNALINDSNIPFLTDLNEFDKLPQSFQAEIKKNYIEFYPNFNNKM